MKLYILGFSYFSKEWCIDFRPLGTNFGSSFERANKGAKIQNCWSLSEFEEILFFQLFHKTSLFIKILKNIWFLKNFQMFIFKFLDCLSWIYKSVFTGFSCSSSLRDLFDYLKIFHNDININIHLYGLDWKELENFVLGVF